ncbi:hypothetical protein HYY69_03880 [Candidatus Woesearchaeota archaeon]|nr:hypothetical protein [Candidatus Woesearchaeota archaeon]
MNHRFKLLFLLLVLSLLIILAGCGSSKSSSSKVNLQQGARELEKQVEPIFKLVFTDYPKLGIWLIFILFWELAIDPAVGALSRARGGTGATPPAQPPAAGGGAHP